MPRIPQGVPRPVDAETLEALLVHAHGWDRWLVLLGACAGLRVSEIAKVRGEDFDLAAGRLWVEGKGGARKPIALHAELAAIAARCAPARAVVPVAGPS